ncbi:MAG: sigma-54-dependent transcriptional regulator [Gemmatimonadales bacterium]
MTETTVVARRPRILVADDQPDILDALRLLLKGENYDVETALSPAGVLLAVQGGDLDAALIDLNYARDTTSGDEGIDLLGRIRAADATLPVSVMTAWGSVDGAVEAMRRGAYDYVEKPWSNERLVLTLRRQVEMGRALRAGRQLQTEIDTLRSSPGRPLLIAESPRMRPVLDLMARIAPSEANVLITGEHGTGKELVAQWLHAASGRAQRPFTAVNLGGLSEGVFESEMFGHVRGAFTDAKTDRAGRFELADGGSLFLDEIANISMGQQSKLLRVLQTREVERVGSSRTKRVDVRIMAATNADLRDEVTGGRFREDLLFRINTIEIALPPLRDRREDILPLARHFLDQHALRYGRRGLTLDAGAAQALLTHNWPGNVRELDHAVERGVLLAQGATVRAGDLGLRPPGPPARLEDLTLAEAERAIIDRALSRFGGNVSQAAKALGLSRSALYRRLESNGQ